MCNVTNNSYTLIREWWLGMLMCLQGQFDLVDVHFIFSSHLSYIQLFRGVFEIEEVVLVILILHNLEYKGTS